MAKNTLVLVLYNIATFDDNYWSSPQTFEDGSHLVKFDGYIDLGRELSLLHTLLSEALSNCEKVIYLIRHDFLNIVLSLLGKSWTGL